MDPKHLTPTRIFPQRVLENMLNGSSEYEAIGLAIFTLPGGSYSEHLHLKTASECGRLGDKKYEQKTPILEATNDVLEQYDMLLGVDVGDVTYATQSTMKGMLYQRTTFTTENTVKNTKPRR